jgi:hypothetical protein
LFAFDPDLVPSIPVDPFTQLPPDVAVARDPALDFDRVRERAINRPVCRTCVDRSNAIRRADGRELIHVLPGAYPDEDEAS